jgi:hypothetical protein
MSSTGRFSWNMSLIEFTKMVCGRRHRIGSLSASDTKTTFPFQRPLSPITWR